MGYCIEIGEAVLVAPEDPGGPVRIGVDAISSERAREMGAPLNSSENHRNVYCPSCSSFSAFVKRHGFDGAAQVLGDGHSGNVALTEDDVERWRVALASFVAVHGWHGHRKHESELVYWDRRRLKWWAFWTRWAFENCKIPIILS